MVTNYKEYKEYIDSEEVRLITEHPDDFREIKCVVGYYMGHNIYKSGALKVNAVRRIDDNYITFESDDGKIKFSVGTLFSFICMRGSFCTKLSEPIECRSVSDHDKQPRKE